MQHIESSPAVPWRPGGTPGVKEYGLSRGGREGWEPLDGQEVWRAGQPGRQGGGGRYSYSYSYSFKHKTHGYTNSVITTGEKIVEFHSLSMKPSVVV